jgi:thiol-disulfide isomerase/thioredoxin
MQLAPGVPGGGQIMPRITARLCALTAIAALGAPGSAAAVDEGQPAPQFALASLSGDGKVSIAQHRGKVVYVDFWASWCAPCLKAVPALEKLRKEFPASDFQVIAINLDRDLDRAQKFLADHPVGYPSASDPDGKLPEAFGLETMPTSYLIDRNGVVRYVHRGFRAGDEQKIRDHIRALLGPERAVASPEKP